MFSDKKILGYRLVTGNNKEENKHETKKKTDMKRGRKNEIISFSKQT